MPVVLAYATQPDEPLQVVLAEARVNPATWGRLPRTYIRTSHDEVIPVQVQDRMIAEADQLTPANPFTMHTIAASHFAPITQSAEVADILTSGVGTKSRHRGPNGLSIETTPAAR